MIALFDAVEMYPSIKFKVRHEACEIVFCSELVPKYHRKQGLEDALK